MGKAPKSAKPLAFADGALVNRKSPEYQLGLAKLREWHERCRANRLGIKRKAVEVRCAKTVSTRRNAARKAKGGAK